MKSAKPLLLLLLLSSVPFASIGEELILRVKVISEQAVSEVNLQHEEGVSQHALSKDKAAGVFVGSVPTGALNGIAENSKVVNPYRAVVTWSDNENDQIFLAFRYPVPPMLAVSVYRDISSFKEEDIDAVDKLGSDYESTFKKYFRAKAFHKHWRHTLALEDHYLALRSARIWFDAAVALGKRPVFRMDADVTAIMREYEEKAKTDRRFAERYRKYVPKVGYIEVTIDQVRAAEFDFVGKIPGLLKAGKFDEAKTLNIKAKETLQDAPMEIRKAVEKHQGVNLDLLERNLTSIPN